MGDRNVYRPEVLDLVAPAMRKVELAELSPRLAHGRLAAGPLCAPPAHLDDRGVEDKNPYEIAPSGNAVVVEEQLVKVTQTQNDYNAITNLYKKQVAMFKMALRGRQ